MQRAFPLLVLAVAAIATAVGFVYEPPPEEVGGERGETIRPPPIATPTPRTPPAPDADYVLRVFAGEGPRGGAPTPVDARIRATNVWHMNGWFTNKDPAWEAMLREIEPGALRWPAGHPSQEYCFSRDGGRVEGCDGVDVLTPAHFDAFVALAERVGAEPLIGVNVKTASPAHAADLVRYLNEEKGYGVRWFQLGNEPDLGGDVTGLERINAAWPQFVSAMRDVDPEVRFVGPEVMTGADVMGIHGRRDWIAPFLEENGESVNAISWHLYPLDSEQKSVASPAHPTPERLLQWWTPDWQPASVQFMDVATRKLAQDRDRFAPEAEIWVTEIGPDSGAPGARDVTPAQVAAVWFADALGRFAAAGADAVFQFAFDHYDEDDELSLVDRLSSYDPLPPWYAYWLHAETWGARTLRTESPDDGNVSVHASLRADGKLAVMIVNKRFEASSVALAVEGFRASGAATWTLAADAPTSLDATINGERFTAREIEAGASLPDATTRSLSEAWSVPPTSVTFVVLSRA